MAPASTKTRKKAFIDTSNAKIDSYFKRCPPSTKRNLENDENAPFNDENRKLTPSPPNSQEHVKRQFGTIKPIDENIKKAQLEQSNQEPNKRQFGEIKTNDENAKKTPSSSRQATLKRHFGENKVNDEKTKKARSLFNQEPLKRQFGDIKFNDENQRKTPSPSNSQQSQQKDDIKSSAYKALRLGLMDNSPKISLKIQSPKPQQAQSKRTAAFAVLCDEDIKKGIEKAPTPPSVLRVLRDSQDDSQSDSQNDSEEVDASQGAEETKDPDTQFIQEGDIDNTQWTEITSSPICVFPDDEDELPIIVYTDKENATETEKENKASLNDDGYEDEDDDDSDLFPKTNEGVINFKPVTIDKLKRTPSNDSQFFVDDEDDTASPFFNEEDDDEQAPYDNDNDFSVGVNEEAADSASLTLGPTLSPGSSEAVSQVHVPYSNPRGKDLCEKLGIEKNDNENESEGPESDNLPW